MKILVSAKQFYTLNIPDNLTNDDIQIYIEDHLSDLSPKPDVEPVVEYVKPASTFTDN